MQINTQQLRTALQTASDNIVNHQQNRTGEAKVENLNLKNVYISSKGEVHVSKGGWNRMWAGMMGRNTGAAALRQAMTGTDGKGFNIPEKVADRALQNITKHQGAHSQWAAGHNALKLGYINQLEYGYVDPELEAKLDRSKAEEPSRNLEGMIGQAAKETRHADKDAAAEAPQMRTPKKSPIVRALNNLPMESIPEASEEAENEPDQPTTTNKQDNSFSPGIAGEAPGGPSKPVADKQAQNKRLQGLFGI